MLRSARSAGLRLPEALRQANRMTLVKTGMDMLAELGLDPATSAPAPEDDLLAPLQAWAEGAEAGRYYGIFDIIQAVFGFEPGDRKAWRVAGRLGLLLPRVGFARYRVRGESRRMSNLWMKAI